MRKTSSITIASETEYEKVMLDIESLMDKGEANLTTEENDSIRNMALAAQSWEQSHYRVAMPKTLEELIELRMYEMHIKQKEMAEKLGISNTKLSLILSGRQKPDIQFIKAVHTKLHVDADFILSTL